MSPQRLQIKLFTRAGSIDKDALINQFHSWIQEEVVEEIAIDVADYSHVPDGPGILLITHEADYAFDEYGGSGVRYVRKKEMPETLVEAVLLCYKQVLKAAIQLESGDEGDVQFDPSLVEITIFDRRLYPNTPESEKIPSELLGIFTALFGEDDATYTLTSHDSRYPLAVRIRVQHGISLEAILQNLENTLYLIPSL